MANILLIETSTDTCSVALSSEKGILSAREALRTRDHASVLLPFVDEILCEAGMKTTDIEAVAISCGPGSYTGLRIGLSTAKGICFALGVPLIAIPTLKAMAAGMLERGIAANTLLSPMLDARRMEVYTALFDGELNKISPTEPKILTEDIFSDYLSEHKIIFFGNGAGKLKGIFEHPNADFVDDFELSAKHFSLLAQKFFDAENFVDVAYYQPLYLKEFMPGPSKK